MRLELETLKARPVERVPTEEVSTRLAELGNELSKFKDMYEGVKKELERNTSEGT